MSAHELPLVVADELRHLPANRWAPLADVIVTTGHGCSVAELATRLFTLYPGLALAVVVEHGRIVHLRSREGNTLAVSTRDPMTIRSPLLRDFAGILYAERVRRARPRTGLVAQRGGARRAE